MNKVFETMPEFLSEAEEAEWWDAHAEDFDGQFEEAADEGTLMNREQFREKLLREHELLWPDARVSVIVSEEDLASVKAHAKTSGLSPEAYLGQIVHEALQTKRAA